VPIILSVLWVQDDDLAAPVRQEHPGQRRLAATGLARNKDMRHLVRLVVE
jgi:hypothetical protein